MMSGSVANWPRGLSIGMGLLAVLFMALIVSSCGLVSWYLSAIYPDARHISSNSSSNGITQLAAGAYRWKGSTVTYFESNDTPDKIIKWYGPRYRIKTFHLGPVSVSLITNEVHYTPPVLYRTETEIEVSYEP